MLSQPKRTRVIHGAGCITAVMRDVSIANFASSLLSSGFSHKTKWIGLKLKDLLKLVKLSKSLLDLDICQCGFQAVPFRKVFRFWTGCRFSFWESFPFLKILSDLLNKPLA